MAGSGTLFLNNSCSVHSVILSNNNNNKKKDNTSVRSMVCSYSTHM